jgi:tRNA 2-selenouridine synthase
MSYTTTIAEAVAEIDRYDAIIDVRSPAEFAEDHMPGAVNWPVLDDQERHDVGLLYATSPFEARKLGAALLARNVARHLETRTAELPKTWRPLVYCWRGGQRSGSMHWFLGQIGFRSRQLAGGYKAYRTQVRDDLQAWPARFDWRVLCGRTGSGKTRLLHALAAEGAQVLDLEALAAHRGSVLGALPDAPQPSQKAFDSGLWSALRGLDASRPIFVESESRKIGRITVPAALLDAMRGERSACVWISMPEAARVELLLQDYGHFSANADGFCQALDGLVELRGHARVEDWQKRARTGDWAGVFAELMRDHYDPGYERSLRGHFPALARAQEVTLADGSPECMRDAARALLNEGL